MERTTLRKNMQIKKVSNSANKIMGERKSIRKYDRTHKIDRTTLKNILQDAMTAPSSLNMQPWRFVVIESEEEKAKLLPHVRFNVQQCETASAIIAIYGDLQNLNKIEDVYGALADNELISEEAKEKSIERVSYFAEQISEEQMLKTVMQDCGYVGMQLMLSAKAYGYDTNPIGGFEEDAFNEILDIDASRYVAAVIFTIGKANGDDGRPSMRFSVDDITQWK